MFTAAGIREILLEFYPNGTASTQQEGWCAFYVRCPEGVSMTLTLFAGQVRKGPIRTRFDGMTGKGLSDFCPIREHMKVQVKPKRTIVLHACHACSLPATHVQLRIDTLRRYGFVQCVNVQDNTTLVQINYLRTVWCIQAPKCVQRILETAIGPSWNRRAS